MSLDTGSTFNSTNDRELMINIVEAAHPITPRTNVGQQEMKKCGEIPEMTEEMWLDEKLMITAMSFAKLAECYPALCNNWNGESFQVHTKIGIVKFRKSEEGLHHHEFSPEFIERP